MKESSVMIKNAAASLVALAYWASLVHAQASLGTPVVPGPPCETCNSSGAYGARVDGRAPARQSGLGQLARSLMTPIRVATGNLLPNNQGDNVSKEEVARMIADGGYSPAEIVAAKIKIDEAQAQPRRAAVRFLAGVDCHYYPEAELGLVAALRADRSECVRLEAAVALGTCNCLTSRIMDALSVCAMGTEIDGNPAESSDRVRFAAQTALNRCLAKGVSTPTGPPQMLPPADWSPSMPAPMTAPIPGSFQSPMPMPDLFQSPLTMPMPDPFRTPLEYLPASYAVPSTPERLTPALMYERSRAENISANVKNTSVPTGQRTLYHLLFTSANREPATLAPAPAPAPAPVQPQQAARNSLGLAPLGPEFNLAIPR